MRSRRSLGICRLSSRSSSAFRQRHLDIRLVDLHLVVAEGILLDPFVANRIEHEVLQTAEQIDRPVVVAFVPRLHMGIQSVDVGIVDRLQREVLPCHTPAGYIRSCSAAGGGTCWP